jgi:hypothetical protein
MCAVCRNENNVPWVLAHRIRADAIFLEQTLEQLRCEIYALGMNGISTTNETAFLDYEHAKKGGIAG